MFVRPKLTRIHSKVKDVSGSVFSSQYPGYSSELKQETTENYEYPNGKVWQKLFSDGKFERN